MKDPELMGLQHEWQRLGSGAPADLSERADREARRARRGAALEIFAVALSTCMFAWLIVRSRGALEVTGLAVIVLLFNGLSLAQRFAIHSRQHQLHDHGAVAFAEKLRMQLTTRRQRLDFSWRATVVLTLIVAVWSPFWVFRHLAVYQREPWRGVVGFGTAAIILLAVFVWTHLQRRKTALEIARFDQEIALTSLE